MAIMKKMTELNLKKIAFGIGSNLGRREENIKIAITKLQNALLLGDVKISNFYANMALLPPNANESWNLEFLNIAVIAKFDREKFPPFLILKIIKTIENEIGRRDSPRWSPREIDIDILAISDEEIIDENDLQIPHKGLFLRDFFYKTFGEIDQEWLRSIRNNL
jgi:2-amino-4-hydroxy-6-hydroxymethyldihydropteridine diphosphokinase